jgi:hypothetical protein
MILVGKRVEKRPLGRPERIWCRILKWTIKNVGMRAWSGFFCLRTGTSGDHLFRIMNLRFP